MADSAFQKQYRQEYIASFEAGQSSLRMATTTEMMRQGNEAVFLVAGSGGAEAVTRGINGLIPSRATDYNQPTATLVEWHDKPQTTRFNAFASQGDQRKIMQDSSVKVMNRKIDDDIIAQLDTATVNLGAAATASLNMVTHAQTLLGTADVDIEEMDSVFGIITPAFRAYLLRDDSFASADYVDVKPLSGGPLRKMLNWAGVNWIVNTRLTGMATASEKCYLLHRDAIGHACDIKEVKVNAGYNDEEDYHYARCSMFMGSKVLQNAGIVQMIHDGSALVAA